ncbi:MAG: membrane protease YdiL (CAAX protease family) [Glaciecola sp.]|jgi:membrane protease YdiL (CAAX protease family)
MLTTTVNACLSTKRKNRLLWAELGLLFLVLPIILALNPYVIFSIALAIVALIYVVYICKSEFSENSFLVMWKQLKTAFRPNWKGLWPRVGIKFMVFALLTSVFVFLQMPDSLFVVLIKDPILWISVCLFYFFVSVLPQEFLYRSFFFRRYKVLVDSAYGFIVLNGTVFCAAHLMFHNWIVLLITFCGGLLFAYTYHKTKSYWLVSAEHSFYGLWIFTLGMGEMLAFPAARAITLGVQ